MRNHRLSLICGVFFCRHDQSLGTSTNLMSNILSKNNRNRVNGLKLNIVGWKYSKFFCQWITHALFLSAPVHPRFRLKPVVQCLARLKITSNFTRNYSKLDLLLLIHYLTVSLAAPFMLRRLAGHIGKAPDMVTVWRQRNSLMKFFDEIRLFCSVHQPLPSLQLLNSHENFVIKVGETKVQMSCESSLWNVCII